MPPTRHEILESLSGALERASNGRAKLDQLDDGAKIVDDIGLSSLDILDLRCDLEERWRITIADEELAQMQTIADIVRVIKERGRQRTG